MSEYHDTGLTKQENYRIARHQVDSDFDKRLSQKSFFESKRDIEAEREKALKKVENSAVKDAGLVQIVKLRLADAQLAQKKYDEALKTLANVAEPTFKATVDELRGDIFVAKKDTESVSIVIA